MRSLKNKLKERIALIRLQQGDTEAFGFIYDTYSERIYRYIYFRISDKETTNDIVQEVFLQTWEYIVSKKTVDNLQSFLYRVAYHKIVDFYRVKERQALLLESAHEDIADSSEANKNEIDLHFLKKKILSLKPEYQDILILKYIEGLSVKEIGSILGKDLNNVRVTLHRAVTALKNLHS